MKKTLLCILLFISHVVFAQSFDTTPKLIETVENVPGYKNAIFKDYTFSFPNEYSSELFDEKNIIIKNKGKAVFFITFSTMHILKGFNSRREFLIDEINSPEDKKEIIFKDDDRVEVYKKDDGFYFLREDNREDTKATSTVTVSSPQNDDYFYISFLVDDDTLKMNVLKSFRLK